MCVHHNNKAERSLPTVLGGPDACRPCTEHLVMLRVYRFAGGLLGLIAVWIASLRSDLQPNQYLAVLLVSTHCHAVICCTAHHSSVCVRSAPLVPANVLDVIAGPSLSCCSVWALFSDFPNLWCNHLPHCSRRSDSFAAGMYRIFWCTETCCDTLFFLQTMCCRT